MHVLQRTSASVDVLPLFLEKASDLHIEDTDLIVESPSMLEEEQETRPAVCIQHIPTGLRVQSSGAYH